MGTNCRRLLVMAACLALLGLAGQPANAADPPPVLVQATDSGFQPSQVSIDVNGSVAWKNVSKAVRNVKSEANLWDSGDLQPGAVYTLVFKTPGTYYYYDLTNTGAPSAMIVVGGGGPVYGNDAGSLSRGNGSGGNSLTPIATGDPNGLPTIGTIGAGPGGLTPIGTAGSGSAAANGSGYSTQSFPSMTGSVFRPQQTAYAGGYSPYGYAPTFGYGGYGGYGGLTPIGGYGSPYGGYSLYGGYGNGYLPYGGYYPSLYGGYANAGYGGYYPGYTSGLYGGGMYPSPLGGWGTYPSFFNGYLGYPGYPGYGSYGSPYYR